MTTSAARNVFNLSDILGERSMYKKPDITISENLLVLSCAIYRLKKQDPNMPYISLTDNALRFKVTDEDKDLAEKITKHFQQKLLVLKLKSVTLTNYRNDLMEFLKDTNGRDVDQGYIYPEHYLGLAYRLPYFYFYDLEIKDIFGGDFGQIKGGNRFKGNLTLKFLKTIVTHKKYNNSLEYWFTDSNDNKVMLSLDPKNSLVDLFNKQVRTSTITVSAKFSERRKDNISFLAPDDQWKIVLE